MSPADQDLLTKLQALLARLAGGDPAARDAAGKLKEASKRGDKVAARAWGTLAALYWGKTQRRKAWAKAEAFYARLTANEPKAVERLKKVHALARDSSSPRSDDAKKAFAMLKAVHNHRKESVWYPGAPKTGYYPMPQRHRPGIVTGGPFDIPGLGGLPGNLGIPGLGGGGGIPGLPPGLGGPQPSPLGNLGNLGQFIPPGLIPPGGIPGLPPGLGGPQPNPLGNLGQFIPPGVLPPGLLGGQPVPPGLLQSPEGQALSNFLPITPQSMQGLLGMITQARQSPSSQSFVQAAPPGGGGGGGPVTSIPFTALAPSTAFTTVPKPSGALALGRVKAPTISLSPGIQHLSMAEQDAIRADESRLSAMVASAIARKSPAAPGLQRQLAALQAANRAKGITASSFEF
jgi:hypothetical protein